MKPAHRFHPDALISNTLPPKYYYDPQIYEQEKERIFYRSWQYVGNVQDLRKPGDYITADLLDQKILVVRTGSGSLKAYYNICSHRGHLLAKGKGCSQRLICPFHAWAYDLEGNLKTAPNSAKVAGFNFAEHNLVEVRVEQLLNLVMVNLDKDALPLAEMAGGLNGEVRFFLPNIETFHFSRTDKLNLKCNWKFVFDQLECYHCPVVHPSAALAVDFTRRETQEHEWYHHAVSYLDGRGRPQDELLLRANPTDAFQNNHVWYLWPNYMMVGRPGPANFNLIAAVPRGPENTDVYLHHFHPVSPPLPENVRQMDQAINRTWAEDGAAIESQQNGVRCRGYSGGRLMVDAEHSYLSEHATHWFDRKIWEVHNGSHYDP